MPRRPLKFRLVKAFIQPDSFRDGGNMVINSLGTREQKGNQAWNRETKAMFLKNRKKKTFWEHGNTRKISLGIREQRCSLSEIVFSSVHLAGRREKIL